MALTRSDKEQLLAEYENGLAQAPHAFLLGYQGITVPQVTELRNRVRASGGEYLVVKNTLALRATVGTPLEALSRHFVGPTAVAYNADNPVALAKVLTAFAKANPNLVFKGAVVEGRPVEAKEIQAIAELPSREELVGKLLFLIQSPVRRLVSVLNGPARSLVAVVAQIADQKSKSGPAEASPGQ
jgi:large subunit ribosomal protein L10